MVSPKKMIQLVKPNIPASSQKRLLKVIRSGKFVQGKTVLEFEKKLASALNCKHVVALSSGTAALHSALYSLDIESDDEIIVPAFSFPATANVVEALKVRPVFVDISLDDFCIHTEQLEAAITNKTKAIIVVHAFGLIAKLDEILNVAKRENIKIVEDAACALGSEYKSKSAGTICDIGCISFHPRKIITTGEGGAVVTNDASLAKKVRSFRNHGLNININESNYNSYGLNYRMTEIHATLGLSQLKKIMKNIKNRIGQAAEYNRYLQHCKNIHVPKYYNNLNHNYQTYHILLNENVNRDNVINALKESGIESNFGANALHILPYYKEKYKYKESDFPNALKAYQRGLALPIGPHITQKHIKYIAKTLKKIVSCQE
jgi:dTDP-4-amino-4,6-dideoxygalactose transaminase